MNASLLAFEIATYPTIKAVDAIRHGIPVSAFDGVAEALCLSAEELANKLGVSMRTVRDQRKRQVPLSSEVSEKLVRTARIHELGRKLFSSDKALSEWLAAPAPALDGSRPLDLLDTDLGAREIEAVLLGIAHGNVL